MPVPTITSVSPSVMFAGGQLITITGTNFRIAYPPPSVNGVLPPPLPTVLVTVGGREARRAQVPSSTEIQAMIPPLDIGPVSVTVQNLDVAGVAIPGEVVTRTSLLEVQRADLTLDSDLTRLERTLILELQRQIHPNVLKTAATDFDASPVDSPNMVEIGELPALVLQGPQVIDNRPYDIDLGLIRNSGANWTKHRIFKVVNLTYRFVGMDNSQIRNMNIQTLMLQFLQNNPFIEMLRDEADPSKGWIQYEMAQVGEFTTFTGSSSSDIRGFSGSLVIRGFVVEDVAGFVDQTVAERGTTVDNVLVEAPVVFDGNSSG
jgi:hypothetical protein